MAQARIQSVVVGDNSDLIAAVGPLFIGRNALTLDLTYGRGIFWKKWAPRYLETNDGDPRKRKAAWHEDFRNTTWEDRQFEAVVFDPPYVSTGGRKTTTLEKRGSDMGDRYDMLRTEKNPLLQHTKVIAPGIAEAARIAAPGGRVLVKCMDYTSSGSKQMGMDWVREAGAHAGLKFFDYVVHYSGLGPQPGKNLDGTVRRQVHVHMAHSYLAVFKKPRRR